MRDKMQSFSLDVAQLTKQISDLQQQCLGLLGSSQPQVPQRLVDLMVFHAFS